MSAQNAELHCFDPVKNEWEGKAKTCQPHFGSSLFIVNNRLCLAGGKVSCDNSGEPKGNPAPVEVYKEESNNPGEVICKFAKNENAQFVVMGSRGVGTLRRTFLGSVSHYCVHHTDIPLAVVPPPKK